MDHEEGLIQAQPHSTVSISRQTRFMQQAFHVGRRAGAPVHVAKAQGIELVRHASIAAQPDSGIHEHALEVQGLQLLVNLRARQQEPGQGQQLAARPFATELKRVELKT